MGWLGIAREGPGSSGCLGVAQLGCGMNNNKSNVLTIATSYITNPTDHLARDDLVTYTHSDTFAEDIPHYRC